MTHFNGGLILADEDAKLRHRRNNTPHDSYDAEAKYPNRIEGEFIYGGPLNPHFGHFMSESIHRILPSKLLHNVAPWIFVTTTEGSVATSFETLPGFAREVYNFVGIDANEFRLVAENSVVDRLFVAEQGSELGLGPKPGYLDDLHEYITPRLDALHGSDARPKKVYVSRRGAVAGNFLGEQYLEEQLKAEGFSIVQPETFPVSVQLDIYRKADVLIFNEGSACHGVELLGTGALRKCYLLSRRKWNTSFDSVLQPRASEYARSGGHAFLGSVVVARRSGRPSKPRGVTLFDVHGLTSFFREHGIAKLPEFNERQYMDAAEIHLHRYIEDASSSKAMCDSMELDRFLGRFEAAKARLEMT